jgi:hypothetical protein
MSHCPRIGAVCPLVRCLEAIPLDSPGLIPFGRLHAVFPPAPTVLTM